MKTNFKSILLGLTLICGCYLPMTVAADLGTFNVTTNCIATKNIRPKDNAGQLPIKAGETYTAINLNKPGGSFVLLRISGSQPTQRWVKLSCGNLSNGSENGSEEPKPTGGESGAASKSGKFLLAASWQPAFCESDPGEGKKECATQTNDRFDANHFTLHGLWPQPRGNYYCMVAPSDKRNDTRHNWNNLPEPTLSPEARSELNKIMPGTQSNLQRHEWIKHGTCFGTGPEAYFRTAAALLDQLNHSELQRVVSARIGEEIATTDLRAAFEQTFGPGSGAALLIECSKDAGRTLISGVSISLQGILDQSSKLQNVLDTAAHPKPQCTQGVIDPVGTN